MNVILNPELEKFVNDQVASGRFASPADVFEAGIRQMMLEESFDSEDLAAFEEADQQIAAGQVHTIPELRREFLNK